MVTVVTQFMKKSIFPLKKCGASGYMYTSSQNNSFLVLLKNSKIFETYGYHGYSVYENIYFFFKKCDASGYTYTSSQNIFISL